MLAYFLNINIILLMQAAYPKNLRCKLTFREYLLLRQFISDSMYSFTLTSTSVPSATCIIIFDDASFKINILIRHQNEKLYSFSNVS